MNELTKDYYLGLDIGTDSVGWAVTDTAYHILRKKGKSLWGIRLFDAANTAAERRVFRSNRRRLQRRRQRINLLQELFAEEMKKVDDKFFQRLKDSAFYMEDKTEKQIYSLFNDIDYTDFNYNKEFPTIYHLRAALLRNDRAYDIRLVYLAIHHMMKNRGHFLFSGSVDNVTSFTNTFYEFKRCLEEELNIEFETDSEKEFEDILKDKRMNKTSKCAKLEAICHIEKSNKQMKEIFKLITGMKVNMSLIFNDVTTEENEHNKISFADSNYDEVRELLEDEIQERVGVVDICHSVYNWVILADILEGGEYNGHAFLSMAKVRSYDKHHEDLKWLKAKVKQYCPKEYKSFFASDAKDNYCAYVGKYVSNGKKINVKYCNQDDFYKAVKKLLGKMPDEVEGIKNVITEIDNKTFLPLQVSKDNGVIPYQVNKLELKTILENVSNYLPFLKDVDNECDMTISEKILSIFEFRIPYYVGPLNTTSDKNSWMVRREGETGAIRPWNFDTKVDRDKSAAEFIQRMTNQCTYLSTETVLPKYSLLYSEFMVLNELNNVRIRGEKLSVELKQKIYNALFKEKKQVTGNSLLEYLNSYGYGLQKEDLSGFDGNFKSSLSSYITLKNILGDDINNYSVQQMAEDIILWITLYGDDQKMLKRVIKQYYGDTLSEEQIKRLSRLKFHGWGRLSKCFLADLTGVDKETGECFTIIQGLRNTQNNLMQLLSAEYTFAETVEELNAGFRIEGDITYDNLVKDVVASPSVKRSVWQTIQIVEEIKKVMGYAPKKIFLEMARSEEEKKRTTSRKDKLLDAYVTIDKEMKSEWCKELSDKEEGDFKSIKLFLYYTQMGQCMYSGEKIDLSQLMHDTTIWDRDHIYPQSKTKDDSLDNLVLVKRTINAKKSDGMISADIQQKMRSTWEYLWDKGLISDKKYKRLIRTNPLTDEELAGFINRQLVETRQSSKVVATLLKRVYDETEIVYVKAKAVSDFRKMLNEESKKTGCSVYTKVRELNDYHHAKDAYLNIVVGNVYHAKFTSNPLKWIKENPNEKYSLNQMFNFDLTRNGMVIWIRGKEGTSKTVNQVLNRNDILFTRYAYCNKGGLFDQQIVKAPDENKKDKAKKLIPIKKGMDTSKYGGYKSVTPSHFMLVESKDKKGDLIRTIETVPLYKVRQFNENPELLVEYCVEFYGLIEPRIIIPCIKKNAKLIINGFPMHLKGSTGAQLDLQVAVQLCIDNEKAKYLRKIIKYIQDNSARKDKKKLLLINPYMGITNEMNIIIYDMLTDKLSHSIYQHRPANPYKKLEARRDKFISLSIEEQCVVISELLHLFQCKPVNANLLLINESKDTGKVNTNKKISGFKSIKLVDQSPTGLYEQVTDLLTI